MNHPSTNLLPGGVAVYAEQQRMIVMVPAMSFLQDDSFMALLVDTLLKQPLQHVLELRLCHEQPYEAAVGGLP